MFANCDLSHRENEENSYIIYVPTEVSFDIYLSISITRSIFDRYLLLSRSIYFYNYAIDGLPAVVDQ